MIYDLIAKHAPALEKLEKLRQEHERRILILPRAPLTEVPELADCCCSKSTNN
jgi:hypothetical protein